MMKTKDLIKRLSVLNQEAEVILTSGEPGKFYVVNDVRTNALNDTVIWIIRMGKSNV